MTVASRVTLLCLMLVAAAPLTLARQTFATRGIVKRAARTELVLSRFQKRGDITIALSSSTHVEGEIKVGVTVSVRYRDEAGHHVATAVSVEPPKPQASKRASEINAN